MERLNGDKVSGWVLRKSQTELEKRLRNREFWREEGLYEVSSKTLRIRRITTLTWIHRGIQAVGERRGHLESSEGDMVCRVVEG